MTSSDFHRTTEGGLLADIAAGLHVPRRIVAPLSWAGHIPFASWIMHALRPRIVVELGVHTGNSFFTFAEAAAVFDLPSELYGIDTWAGDDHAGAYAEEVFVEVSHIARTRFPDRVHLLRKTFDDAVAGFADGSVDLLHIDGLHTYEAVRHDFESWRCKLSTRAVVLFHDIAVVEIGFGVARFWSEIQRDHPTLSFVHSNGLGVLFFGTDLSSSLRALADPGPLQSGVVDLFGKLGDFLLTTIRQGPEAGTLPVNAFLDPPSIYLAIDGAFDEKDVVEAKPVPGLPGTLHAALPPAPAGKNVVLRIDPTSHLGIRTVHRIVLVAEGHGAPVELVAKSTDRRERVTIVPIDAGTVFLATGEDSQWFPQLGEDALTLLRAGATIVFEPIAAPAAALSQKLLASALTLAAPLEERLAALERLEKQQLVPSFAEALKSIERLETELIDAGKREASGREAAETRIADLEARLASAIVEGETARRLVEEGATALSLAKQQGEVVAAELSMLFRQLEAFESPQPGRDAPGTASEIGTQERIAEKLRAIAWLSTHRDARVARLGAVLGDLFKVGEVMKGRLIARHAPHLSGQTDYPRVRGTRICRLEPASGLAPLDDKGQAWHATDSDPQFAFSELVAYAGKWIELTIGIAVHELEAGNPVLYLDIGEGMSEAMKMELPRASRNAATTSIIFYVPPKLKSARLDPCSSPVAFALTQVGVEALSKWQAMRRMARSLGPSGRFERFRTEHRPHWRQLRTAAARQRLKQAFIDEYRRSLLPRAPDYADWIAMFEPQSSEYPALAAGRDRWAHQPLISVLMPTYNTPAGCLREAIESVIKQNYGHWELCIADDASSTTHVRQILRHYAKSDPRIRVTYRPTNGHISAASNSALGLATGPFVALLDHDDVLHPLALHYLAEAIVLNPAAKLIYSDEDKLDRHGVRQTPYFKCDFNPELFLAQNLITHLGCYDTALVRQIGGFRLGLEGSQDWDLALRIYEQIEPAQIVHIPRVLYHWRELAGSTALAIDQKPYIEVASRRAVEDHLKRRAIDAVVMPAPGLPMWNRVRYPTPSEPRVTIVIPTRDKVEVLRKAVDSVLELTRYANFDVIVVDNGSVEPETFAYLRALPADRVHVVRDDSPFNYSRINNEAIRLATGELICLLNNDVEAIDGDWLSEMVSMMSGESVGIVGARLWYPDMRLQHAGVILGIGGVAGHAHRLADRSDAGYFGRAVLHQQMSAVTGACLLIKRSVWDSIGGLDEKLGVAFNDIDLCLRAAEAGFRTIWTPYAEMIHHESISRGAEDTPEKIRRFNTESDLMRARWGERLLKDPFYSPNLTLVAEDFSISWQPRIEAVPTPPPHEPA